MSSVHDGDTTSDQGFGEATADRPLTAKLALLVKYRSFGILSSMSTPVKHHFIPAFALKAWSNRDGNVFEMRRLANQDKVHPKWVHPNATGFQRDLYRTEGLPLGSEQHLEQEFLAPLDNLAGQALQKFLNNDLGLDETLRSAWTTYILSLIFRRPEAVRTIRQHMSNIWEKGLLIFEETYEERRGPNDPGTFDEYKAKTNPHSDSISGSNLLMKVIDNNTIGPVIFNMNWSIIPVEKSRVSLLISDCPIDRPHGLSDPRAYIATPISPTRIFLAANDPRLASVIRNLSPTSVAKSLNKLVVAQAHEFVWSQDEQQLAFVEKHIGTAPPAPVITPEQEARALSAAMGKMQK